ncbi:vegetative cell wall protein gp1-like [Carassius auratus]|uniref:Vegetative cell wall protein gp1-like n=1 Tax=Carassius auratus TaxID=7957 RepID=A0A6P6JI29_CARAU|nr:vegetative cell wall protein gp1-like [Carassius auratus]
MAIPAVRLLCLEQLDRSLEDHTRDFLDLACLTHFPDRSKARLPANSPQEDFATFVEWVLEKNGSAWTISTAEEDNSIPTPDPETSQPPSRHMVPEPTAAAEPEPSTDRKQDLESATDQVCEPATPCIVGVLVEIEGVEESPAHTPATEGELYAISGKNMEQLMDLMDWSMEVIPNFPVSPLVPSSPDSPVYPLSLPLLPPPVISSAPFPLVPSSHEFSVSPLIPPSSESSLSPLVPPSSEVSVSPVFPPSLPLPPPPRPATDGSGG